MTAVALNHASPMLRKAQEIAQQCHEWADEIFNTGSFTSVNPRFFQSNKDGQGFLKDLIDCFEAKGFGAMKKHAKPQLTSTQKLPLDDFSKGLSVLTAPQLKHLKNLYEQVEYTGPNKNLGWDKVAGYFQSSQWKSSDTGSAGRLLVHLSSVSELLMRLKNELIAGTQPLLDECQKVCDEFENSEWDRKIVRKVDQASQCVDYLLQKLDFPKLDMQESKTLTQKLIQFKKEFVRIMIEKASQLKSMTLVRFTNAVRSFQTWSDWKYLSRKFASLFKSEGPEFIEKVESFRKQLPKEMEYLCEVPVDIKKRLNQRQKVCSYFHELLEETEEMADRLLKAEVAMERDLHQGLQKMKFFYREVRILLQRHMTIEEGRMKLFPEFIRRRLEYFELELPRVLRRGQPAEIRYVLISINSSYRKITQTLKSQIKEPAKYLALKEALRKRFLEIVTSSVSLLQIQPSEDLDLRPESLAKYFKNSD